MGKAKQGFVHLPGVPVAQGKKSFSLSPGQELIG